MQVIPPTRQIPKIEPGQRIRVTQRIVKRDQEWSTKVEGVVVSCKPETTGSWYAHGKNDRLWLLRIRLQKPDGELTTIVVDHNSQIEYL